MVAVHKGSRQVGGSHTLAHRRAMPTTAKTPHQLHVAHLLHMKATAPSAIHPAQVTPHNPQKAPKLPGRLDAHQLHVLHMAHLNARARASTPATTRLGGSVVAVGGFLPQSNSGGSAGPVAAGGGGYFSNIGSGDLAARLAGISWISIAEIAAIIAAAYLLWKHYRGKKKGRR